MVKRLIRTDHKPGTRFHRWVIIRKDKAVTTTRWICRCDCGTKKSIGGYHLERGGTKSCGCYRREVNSDIHRKHGLTGSKEYRSWQAMKNRCRNRKIAEFANYGARGIKVCRRWDTSFENFLADMGPAPSPKHSLDRIDNNGHYKPSNVKWSTPIEQGSNKRSNHLVVYQNMEMSIAQLSRLTGVRYDTIRRRLKRGWDVDRTIRLPVGKGRWTAKGTTK
mgnify:CR=1 FL=1